MSIIVTDAMRAAGNDIAEHLCDAQICSALGGDLGGCKQFKLEDYPLQYRQLIYKYITDDNFDSVEAIYIAMEGAKQDG